MTVAESAAELTAAVEQAAIEGLRFYPDMGPAVSPPCAVLGPPDLHFEAMCTGPTSARWPVYVVVPVGDRALPTLWELVPAVAAALDTVPDAAVQDASPGVYPSSAGDLPAYVIQVDVDL